MEEKDIIKNERLKLADYHMCEARRLLMEEREASEPEFKQPNDYCFTMDELSTALGVSIVTVERLRQNKALPVVYQKGKEVYSRSSVIQAILDGKIIVRGLSHHDLLDRINFYCPGYVD